MGPRLHQIDELNKLGLTPEDIAALLGLRLKTVREYEYRIQIDGEVRPRGNPGFAAQEAERDRMRQILINYETGRVSTHLPRDAHKFYGRIRTIDEAKKEGKMPEPTQHDNETIEQILSARRNEILSKSGSVVAVSAAEAGAALNYFRGRAEEFNETRDAIVRTHPQLAKDLPGPIIVDEIQVRQRVLEHERGEEKSLQMAR